MNFSSKFLVIFVLAIATTFMVYPMMRNKIVSSNKQSDYYMDERY